MKTEIKFKKTSLLGVIPTRSTSGSGAFDLSMPEAGTISAASYNGTLINLKIASEIPPDYVGLILPRSGVGVKHGLELVNTMGVIDSDYRGEWFVKLRLKKGGTFSWQAGDRLLQLLILKLPSVSVCEVKELSQTERGEGGFGSTGTGALPTPSPDVEL